MSPTPRCFKVAISSKSRSISRSVSAEVGSSMAMTRALAASALAISTTCCCPTARLSTRARTSMAIPRLASTARALSSMAEKRTKPHRRGSAPRKMFSATER